MTSTDWRPRALFQHLRPAAESLLEYGAAIPSSPASFARGSGGLRRRPPVPRLHVRRQCRGRQPLATSAPAKRVSGESSTSRPQRDVADVIREVNCLLTSRWPKLPRPARATQASKRSRRLAPRGGGRTRRRLHDHARRRANARVASRSRVASTRPVGVVKRDGGG